MIKRGTPHIPDVGGFIREQRRRGQVSLRKLADLSGVSNPYLSQIERGLRRPSAEVVNRIMHAMAAAMRTSADALYAQAGLVDQPPENGDVLAAIFRDPGLTDKQKRVIAELYERSRIETAERRANRRQTRQATTGGKSHEAS
ncbi:MAG TPA: helix-turn-helix transcriptional regulator [Actinomycetota bacterium]|nr:helix-turn-helix transcriptional regulator [Actinomycetota bacterium]